MNRWRALLIGGIGAAAVFAVLFWLVGGRVVGRALLDARPLPVAVVVVFGLGWLVAWSLMLRSVLVTLGVRLTVIRSVFVYAGAVFANNVTPFGQAGGEPVAALLISEATGEPYETGLAGIATVDVLNVIPSFSLVLVSVGYYATTATVGARLENAVISAVGVVAVIAAALLVAWLHRWRLVEAVTVAVAAIAGRVVPGRSGTVGETLATRAERFFGHFERVATTPRRLLLVLSLSLAGWLLQGGALLAAFAAVGYTVPVYVVLFAIPLGNLAGAAPLPGGLGGIEAAFVALLVPTTSVPAAAVTAAVLIYRGVIYWMPVALGGTVTVLYGTRAIR